MYCRSSNSAEHRASASSANGRSFSLTRLRLPVWLTPNETGAPDRAAHSLAGHLPQPCYGLALPQDCDQLESIADLAAQFLECVKARQSIGPYVIVGCSAFGSLVATAVVTQLER